MGTHIGYAGTYQIWGVQFSTTVLGQTLTGMEKGNGRHAIDWLTRRVFRPISVIDTTQKVFYRVVLGENHEWTEDKKILSTPQAKFRKKTSTVDQASRFLALFQKKVLFGKGQLHVAFVDLKPAFHLVPRQKLWQVLRASGCP
ncbi:hypothetical protein NDU88_009693 [Pleurodeles waltl]|uniref:Reverse transcriptase domain-containing protein n=1 Tax=Pleurodeles waltl TaxID=8319 RepID=A0AAV7QSB6_PLEWA|nr:hypothetical protein NDU88_009693 [Pleurodeles waltl]